MFLLITLDSVTQFPNEFLNVFKVCIAHRIVSTFSMLKNILYAKWIYVIFDNIEGNT